MFVPFIFLEQNVTLITARTMAIKTPSDHDNLTWDISRGTMGTVDEKSTWIFDISISRLVGRFNERERTMNMTELLKGVVRIKRATVKEDKDSVSKSVTIHFDYSECTVEDILTKAVAHDVIAWQNGQGRKSYASLVNGQVVKVLASRPGAAPQVDPMSVLVAEAQALGITIQEHITNKLAGLSAK